METIFFLNFRTFIHKNHKRPTSKGNEVSSFFYIHIFIGNEI